MTYAESAGQRWAFSLSNAGARYTTFRADLDALGEIDWAAVHATDFRREEVKEAKQAEFLIHGSFPWTLVERIGVQNGAVQQEVAKRLACAAQRPPVQVRKDWYYP